MCSSEKGKCLDFKKAKGPERLLSLGQELQPCINSFICALLCVFVCYMNIFIVSEIKKMKP